MDHLNTWNSVKQTPPNFLKKIEGGPLKGKSDINPQWRLMAMTQAYGVVGHGWTYRIHQKWTETAPCGTVMAFAEVAVKTKVNGEWGEEFFGIGGSQIVEIAKGVLKPNDEGYKMAVTDALGVAFKAIGIAADIYLGNFDGSKYLYDYDKAFQETAPEQPSNTQQQSNVQKQTKAQPVAQNNQTQPFPNTVTPNLQQALKAIQTTQNESDLGEIYKQFKGTQHEQTIIKACKAKKDMEGWSA